MGLSYSVLELLVVGGSTDHLRSLREAAAIQRQQEEQGESEERPWQACQRLLMRHLEDIIADMAGFVPLAAIGERILDEFAADSFGDFRGSLTSLLAAYNYELSILQVCSSLQCRVLFTAEIEILQCEVMRITLRARSCLASSNVLAKANND